MSETQTTGRKARRSTNRKSRTGRAPGRRAGERRPPSERTRSARPQADATGAPAEPVACDTSRDDFQGPLGADTLDRVLHAALGRMTLGISPAALAQAWADWAVHLAMAPGKQAELGQKALRKAVRFWLYAG
ncbi:MAG TPA: poly-beta-hydroxybutyrate polymerase N-terminal domain-containing protein, partial [Kiloniellales bacterium]|nr:poly-beta-hydroxybutyrate polymerase N-terminal domain-containing protein [Kiloniellales bacterium]